MNWRIRLKNPLALILVMGFAPEIYLRADVPEGHDIANDVDLKKEIARWLPSYEWALQSDDVKWIRVPQDEIFPEPAAQMRACIGEVIRPEVLPRGKTADSLELYGLQKGESGGINADLEFLGAAIRLSGGGRGLGVRLRVPDRQLISNPLEQPGLGELFSLLQSLLLVPYKSTDDIEIHGKATALRGTTFYTAQLHRRGVDTNRMIGEGRYNEVKLFDSMYVFVSDSVPQYITFSIGSCGPPEDPQKVARMATGPGPPFQLRPLPPEPEDFDPDVSKRPRFRKRLTYNRDTFASVPEFSFDHAWSPERPGGPIPEEYKRIMQQQWTRVMKPAIHPLNSADVEWRWLDRHPRTPDQNPICARWTRNGRRVTVLGDTLSSNLLISVRLTGPDRLSTLTEAALAREAAANPAESQPLSEVQLDELHRIFGNWFQVPVEMSERV